MEMKKANKNSQMRKKRMWKKIKKEEERKGGGVVVVVQKGKYPKLMAQMSKLNAWIAYVKYVDNLHLLFYILDWTVQKMKMKIASKYTRLVLD